MSDPYGQVGFGERGQVPLADIPTEPEAFLRWVGNIDRHHPFNYELSRGTASRWVRCTSRAHGRVTANILGELLQLDRERFDVAWVGFAVRTGVGVRYPDIVIDRAGGSLEDLACEAPIFIAEVLSPSTAGLDFTAKLQEYTGIASVQTYLICAQEEPRAWFWVRQSDASWPKLPKEYTGRKGAIRLDGLGVELAMAAIFSGIPDSPTGE